MPVKSWLTELLVNDSKQCRTVVSRINIPASTTSIPKNAGDVKAKLMPDGVIQSRNSYGFDGFGGMCPPKGDKPHHYMLTVYAVDEDKLQFSKDDMTSPEVVGFETHFHSKGTASLNWTYGRPK